ncbi:hypothetical protein MJO28_003976 [Puccinia striiformis f. sp. tritici]|uniref:Uncharacterized protein n=1 Tax=Puccinia striiformis f. sp. tritici TaxID=168172 RepID=A0ACC0ENI4_9BASI|nr:hypothetical protein MJO28_003976 [Puccinia striiformis f. sp. tritici]
MSTNGFLYHPLAIEMKAKPPCDICVSTGCQIAHRMLSCDAKTCHGGSLKDTPTTSPLSNFKFTNCFRLHNAVVRAARNLTVVPVKFYKTTSPEGTYMDVHGYELRKGQMHPTGIKFHYHCYDKRALDNGVTPTCGGCKIVTGQ